MMGKLTASVQNKTLTDQSPSSTEDKIKKTITEELIFGLCSPIGSNNDEVIKHLEEVLKEYEYRVVHIKLSSIILDHISNLPKEESGHSPEFTSLMDKIRGGDLLRKKYSPAILGDLVIKKIFEERVIEAKLPTETTEFKSRRICYIIDSIKNLKELELLRRTYQDLFYLFGVFSPREERLTFLKEKKNLTPKEAEELIDTDEYENNEHGQNVRNTFIEADFFIRASNGNRLNLKERIVRFLHLIFESKIITPYKHETAMYEAKSAAGNSSCLSRQVGACITDADLNVISSGWNDVPKPGGNLYREGDEIDNRCFTKKKCFNDTTKNDLTEEIVNTLLHDLTIINSIKTEVNRDNLAKHINTLIRRSTKVKDLIEFSRSVHAEMHAIIMGSQLSGTKMIGGNLFCTTYPCHNCARHIVAAGIKQIFYIEPYVKSLCMTLHKDEITEAENDPKKVAILLYDGVAPRQYLHFFSKSLPRKQTDGTLYVQKLIEISPKSSISLQAIPTLESEAIKTLDELQYNPINKIRYEPQK